MPLAALIAGGAAGGVLLGGGTMAASLVVRPVGDARSGLILAAATVSVVGVVFPRLRRWLPERACQVASAEVLRSGRTRAAFKWGLKLGTGVSTFMVTPALYALLGVAAGQREALIAGVICIAYGTSRGATIAGFALTEGRRDAGAACGITKEIGALEQALRAPLAMAIVLASFAAI